MPTSVLTLTTLASSGDVGPATVLTAKDCGVTVTVEFTATVGGASNTIVVAPAGAGQYDTATWKVYGPKESAVVISGPTPETNPQTFVPDYPGRWLVRLTATPFGGSPTVYTSVVEIKDPQFSGVSIPAPNEKAEYDADEGWSRDVEEMHKTVSRSLGFREIVSVTAAAGTLAANTLVTPTNRWMTRWKAAPMSFADFNNYVIEVEAVADAGAKMLTQPVFLLLEAVDVTTEFTGQEKALALVKGIIPYDTTVAGITNGPAGAGADLYALGGATAFDANATPVAARKIARVLIDNLAFAADPGVIYFDGHYEEYFHDLYIGDKLTVGGLIDPTGLEFTPVATNPSAANPADTLWLNSTAADALMWGTKVIATQETLNQDGAVAAEANVHYICVHTAGGGYNVTLPTVATSADARISVTNNDPTTDTITVKGNGAETINGVNTYALVARYDSVTVVCDGTEWFVE